MRTQSPDTDPNAERMQIALLRQAPVARRVRLARSLSQTVIGLAWRAIERAHPGARPAEVALLFVAVHYGEDLAVRLRADVTRRTSMIGRDILDALTPVVEALEQLGIAYHIGGSVASSAFGIARATIDVDLVADMHPADVQPFVERLQPAYYVDLPAVTEAVLQRASFNLIHLATMLKVDVFIPQLAPFDRLAFARAQPDLLDETEGARLFYLASPEDVVLRKLEWYRAGGETSDRQWLDVLGVLKVRGPALDRAYLDSWAGRLGLADLLDRALTDAGI